jgi:hypothetical protein
MISGQVLGALSGSHDLESAGACPVYDFTDQRRLVAIGQAVKASSRFRPLCQQGTGKSIRFHRRHNHMATICRGQFGVANGRLGITGRLDHDFDRVMANQGFGIFGNPKAVFCGVLGLRHNVIGRVSQRQEPHFQAGSIEVRDPDQAQAGRAAQLGKKHGAELSGPDESYSQRPAGFGPGNKLCVEVHLGLRKREEITPPKLAVRAAREQDTRPRRGAQEA